MEEKVTTVNEINGLPYTIKVVDGIGNVVVTASVAHHYIREVIQFAFAITKVAKLLTPYGALTLTWEMWQGESKKLCGEFTEKEDSND